jgi:hypothetical protein
MLWIADKAVSTSSAEGRQWPPPGGPTDVGMTGLHFGRPDVAVEHKEDWKWRPLWLQNLSWGRRNFGVGGPLPSSGAWLRSWRPIQKEARWALRRLPAAIWWQTCFAPSTLPKYLYST